MTRKNEPSFSVPAASDLDTKLQIFKVVARESGIIRAGLDLCKKISERLNPPAIPAEMPCQSQSAPVSIILLETDGIRPGDEEIASAVEQTRTRVSSHHHKPAHARKRRAVSARV